MVTEFQTSVLPQKIDTLLLKVQLWASGVKILKSDLQFNFNLCWEHFLLNRFFCSSDAVGPGGGVVPSAHLAS